MLLGMQPGYPYAFVDIMEIFLISTHDMVSRGSVAPNAGSRVCGVASVCMRVKCVYLIFEVPFCIRCFVL